MGKESIILRRDMINCVLCDDAPCSKACTHGKPDELLRNIWFDNENVAAIKYPSNNPCVNCDAPCEKECVKPYKVPIRELMIRLNDDIKPTIKSEGNYSDIDYESLLKTDVCGVTLENPFLLSSSVISSTYDMCARAFEAGWADLRKSIQPSLFWLQLWEKMTKNGSVLQNYATRVVLTLLNLISPARIWQMEDLVLILV